MNLKIGVIKGDGIGPEIVTEAMKVLDKVAGVYGHTCDYTQLLMGGASSLESPASFILNTTSTLPCCV